MILLRHYIPLLQVNWTGKLYEEDSPTYTAWLF